MYKASHPASLDAQYEENRRIEQCLNGRFDVWRLNIQFAEPKRYQEGDIVYAKAPWNPGAGDGPYVRTAAAWVKLI